MKPPRRGFPLSILLLSLLLACSLSLLLAALIAPAAAAFWVAKGVGHLLALVMP